ncbi:MAG: alpha-ketoacid dehydrogenase subunit beta [Spirochaetaceae bacterium]|nr:MAG: alpha-ketoacid dehydrogenase subunit beta [Spirochaetaceae bacterium]
MADRPLRIVEALREALEQELAADRGVFLIGEDVRIGGGFSVSRGLMDRFGETRILDTPISEIAFTGLAIGAAMSGMRPIVEYQFGDFVFCAMDQIVNEAAKLRYMSAGQVSIPITFRLPVGANRRGAQHAQCTESIFMNVPGLYIATPSTPYDAKGMLIEAIRNQNPVLFYEHKLLYSFGGGRNGHPQSLNRPVPEEPYTVPFGKAEMRREGRDVTIVANLLMLHRALQAAEQLHKEGIEVEVIDPRTLVPLDIESIRASVGKTRRLLVVEECQPMGGWGNEVIAGIAEASSVPVLYRRLGTAPTPIPYTTSLENYVIPSAERITECIRRMVCKG